MLSHSVCRSILRPAETAFDQTDHRFAEVGRTEGVHKRVQPGIDVCQPERSRVQIGGNQFRSGQAHVEHEVERHPAHDIGDHDVGQGDERLSAAV